MKTLGDFGLTEEQVKAQYPETAYTITESPDNQRLHLYIHPPNMKVYRLRKTNRFFSRMPWSAAGRIYAGFVARNIPLKGGADV
jgi:hypothetical protein